MGATKAAAGPTAANRWSSRPRVALLIRAIAVLTPIAVSVLFIALMGRLVERPSGWLATGAWLILLTAASTSVLMAVERLMRKVLPLAALFKMSLAFPDQAPSRYKAAMRTRTLRQLQRGLEESQVPDTAKGTQESAERLLALAMALNSHDRLTRGHTERVRAYTLMIGEEMDLPEADLDRLHWAGLVHDIGKLEVPPELLNKPGKPTDEEWEVIKGHPAAGLRLVEPLRPWLGEWADAASQHHERWDGKGYPFGLKGTEISLSGRIVAVADAYDVMTSVRSYKRAMSPAEARAELARCAGTQFDPAVVRAFLNISIGRLRLVVGGMSSWLTELPLLGRVPLGAVGTAGSALAATTFALATGLAGPEAPIEVRTEAAPPTTAASAPEAPEARERARPTPTTEAAPPPSEDPAVPPIMDRPEPTLPSPTDPTPPAPTDPGVVRLVATTLEDAPVDIDLDAPPFGEWTAALADRPRNGQVALAGSTATYTPGPNWSGLDTFSVRLEGGASGLTEVTVSTAPVNDRPTANDARVVVEEDGEATVNLAPLTGDVEADPLAVSLGDPPRGRVAGSGLQVTYRPDPNVFGTDAFSYVVTDPSGAASRATITVGVEPVDDPPVGGRLRVTTSEDTSAAIDLSGTVTDPDGDPLAIDTVGAADHGVATADGALGVDYQPADDFNGSDEFTVQVTDPGGATAVVTVTVDVAPANDPPVAADLTVSTDEDQPVTIDLGPLTDDPDGDALGVESFSSAGQGEAAAAGLQLTYTPGSDTNGTYTVSYVVADPTGATATGTITVNVQPVADAPVAQDDAFVTSPSVPLVEGPGTLLANDFDVDGEAITVDPSLTVQPLGIVSVSSDGSFVYTPPPLFTGTDTFGYTVTDGTLTDTATVTITVTAASETITTFLTPTPSGTDGWALADAPPPATDPEPDTDGDTDARPGTTLKQTNNGLGESAPDKHRIWSRTFDAATELDGPVTLDLWSMTANGEADGAHVYAWLFDCTGSTCTQLLAADLYADPWNSTNTWSQHTLVLGSLQTTIAAGHDLRLRIQVDNRDLWVAQSGGRPSSLSFTTG